MDYSKAFHQMVNNTLDYLNKNNLETMVLGISGGIDSTVVAFVCAEVAARSEYKKSFMFVSLPSSTNKSEETSIASAIINEMVDPKNLNFEKSITHMFDVVSDEIMSEYCLKKSYNKSMYLKPDDIAYGNIKARLRMITLYNYAYLYKGIVMDTDNLTEHYTGFFTVHGDVGDYSPMGGSLWKTDVYKVAMWLKAEAMSKNPELEYFKTATVEERKNYINILEQSIKLLPTDGNGIGGGSDMDQIAPGFSYNEVDAVLKLYVRCEEYKKKHSISEIVKNGEGYIIKYTNRDTYEYLTGGILKLLEDNKDFIEKYYFDTEAIAKQYFDGNVEVLENLIKRVKRTKFKRLKSPVRPKFDF